MLSHVFSQITRLLLNLYSIIENLFTYQKRIFHGIIDNDNYIDVGSYEKKVWKMFLWNLWADNTRSLKQWHYWLKILKLMTSSNKFYTCFLQFSLLSDIYFVGLKFYLAKHFPRLNFSHFCSFDCIKKSKLLISNFNLKISKTTETLL